MARIPEMIIKAAEANAEALAHRIEERRRTIESMEGDIARLRERQATEQAELREMAEFLTENAPLDWFARLGIERGSDQ